MVLSVSRSISHLQFTFSKLHHITLVNLHHCLCRNWKEFTPKSFHLIAVDSTCRCEEPGGVDHVDGTSWVHIDACFGYTINDSASGRRVVKVDVRE